MWTLCYLTSLQYVHETSWMKRILSQSALSPSLPVRSLMMVSSLPLSMVLSCVALLQLSSDVLVMAWLQVIVSRSLHWLKCLLPGVLSRCWFCPWWKQLQLMASRSQLFYFALPVFIFLDADVSWDLAYGYLFIDVFQRLHSFSDQCL